MSSVCVVSAKDFNIAKNAIEKNNEQIESRYIACPEGGKHIMMSRGQGTVYLGNYPSTSNPVIYGYTFRCRKCGLVICSEHNPVYTWISSLGNYIESYSASDLSYYGSTFWISSRNEIYYNYDLATDDYTRGMEFGYST